MNKDHIIEGLLGNVGNSTFESIENKNTSSKSIAILFTSLTVLLIVSGGEGLKVLFRKNIGRNNISIKGVFISAIFYFLCANYFYNQYNSGLWNFSYKDIGLSIGKWTFASGFYIGSVVYLSIGILVLIMGVIELLRNNKKNIVSSYGDSYYFGFLMRRKFYGFYNNVLGIWVLVEPLTIFFISVLLCVFNPIIGLPLTFQAGFILIRSYFYSRKLIRMADSLDNISISDDNKIFHKVRVV